MSEQRQTYTLDASGQPLTVHQDGVTMPADHSFACVNDYVHAPERHFEELQGLALGMACEIDKLRAEVERLKAENEDLAVHLDDTERRAENAGRNASSFDDRMGDLQVENGQLRTEIERLRHAEARYQFLRDQQALPPDQARYAVMRWNERAGQWLHIDFKLDTEIDAAMAAKEASHA